MINQWIRIGKTSHGAGVLWAWLTVPFIYIALQWMCQSMSMEWNHFVDQQHSKAVHMKLAIDEQKHIIILIIIKAPEEMGCRRWLIICYNARSPHLQNASLACTDLITNTYTHEHTHWQPPFVHHHWVKTTQNSEKEEGLWSWKVVDTMNRRASWVGATG